MSLLVKDIRCPDGHFECSVLLDTNAPIPPCPAKVRSIEVVGPVDRAHGSFPARTEAKPCGKPRTTFFATREQEGQAARDHAAAQVGTFRPTTLDGVVYNDKASLDRHLDAYCAKQGISRDSVSLESTTGGKVRRDEMRHTAWEMRKKDGFDTQRYESYKREQRERGNHGR